MGKPSFQSEFSLPAVTPGSLSDEVILVDVDAQVQSKHEET